MVYGSRAGGAMPDDKKEATGFLRSWIRYIKRLNKDLPWADWRSARDYWKVPVKYFVSHVASEINIPDTPEKRNTFWKNLYGTALDEINLRYLKSARETAAKAFPRVRTYFAHAEGPTRITKLYVYEYTHGGQVYDVPVAFAYMDKDKEVLPDVNTINKGITHVNHTMSLHTIMTLSFPNL